MSDPHSALYLSDARDLWWNADFLALIARRTGLGRDLGRPTRVLDVGAGHGHWTRTIARLVPRGAEVTGLEREPAWVERAGRGPAIDGVGLRFTAGRAEALPFGEASFDVVTCQTLLIHVAEPRRVVAEMVRVLAPGGRLLLVEPNNLAGNLARLVAAPDFDLDDAAAFFRLQARCEQGKHALGEGYSSLGEGLVGLLDPAAVDEIEAWCNDRCVVFAPGRAHRDRPELVEERRILGHGDALIWSRADTRRYFLAGGGQAAELDELWTRARRIWLARLAALERGDAAGNEGGLFYLVSARRR